MKLLITSSIYETTNDFLLKITPLIKAADKSEKNREFLNANFPYELALLQITGNDYSRAKIFCDIMEKEFISKWRLLGEHTDTAKHELIEELQKLCEMKEFLSIMTESKVTDEQIFRTFAKWISRNQSPFYDSIFSWQQLNASREMFCSNIQMRFDMKSTLMDKERVKFEVQCAKGMLKKNAIDSSFCLLTEAVHNRPGKFFNWVIFSIHENHFFY